MINFDTPSSNFIILSSDDWNANAKSDWFNFKEVSIKGQNFLFLSLLNDNLMTSKDLSGKIRIDLQNLIPLGSRNSNKLDQNFFITGYSENDFKFNEYKAFLQQICPKIRLFDNISVIEANTESCKEEDISRLSIFLPFLYPHLSFTSYVPKKRIRIFITNHKSNTISKSCLMSLLKWDSMISQIYFSSDKTIADLVLNEEGEKNYKNLFQDKIILTKDFTLTICKFADMIKINKLKSLEVKAKPFPSNFTLEKAYHFFSEYRHIYRIQIFNENSMSKYVIIQFTSQKSYNLLRQRKNLFYQSKNITINSTQIKNDEDDNYEGEEESEVTINTKNNHQISPLKSRKFIDDVCDEEISRENSSNDNFLNNKSEVPKLTSRHSTRHFIDDTGSDDLIIESSSGEYPDSHLIEETKDLIDDEVKERGINLHLIKDINAQQRNRRNHLFISDSYSENFDEDDNEENNVSFNNSSDRKFFSSSRFSKDLIVTKSGNIESSNEKQPENPLFVQEIVESLSNQKNNSSDQSLQQRNNSNLNSAPKRIYISDDDDNENEESKANIVQDFAISKVKRKCVILEREIDDVGSYSYSDASTESGSFSDSD